MLPMFLLVIFRMDDAKLFGNPAQRDIDKTVKNNNNKHNSNYVCGN